MNGQTTILGHQGRRIGKEKLSQIFLSSLLLPASFSKLEQGCQHNIWRPENYAETCYSQIALCVQRHRYSISHVFSYILLFKHETLIFNIFKWPGSICPSLKAKPPAIPSQGGCNCFLNVLVIFVYVLYWLDFYKNNIAYQISPILSKLKQ